jgi:molybdopterin-biosynthesis enzyme MoeA-like protein
MTESNRQQAFVPQGAHIIRNPRGTAPAFVAKRNGQYVAALPGVPQELHYLTENALLPYLQQELGLNEVLVVREVHLSGLTEAAAGERIADIMLGNNPIVGITAKRGQHTIRIAATGPSKQGADALIEPLLDLINQRFVGHLLGETSLEERVGELLQQAGVRLALLENDMRAPVYRALVGTESGRKALTLVQIRPGIVPLADTETMARSLAQQQLTSEATLSLVVLIERSDNNFRTVHFAVSGAQLRDGLYFARGVDFGLAQAHDFVATGALEMLRRWLEQQDMTDSL